MQLQVCMCAKSALHTNTRGGDRTHGGGGGPPAGGAGAARAAPEREPEAAGRGGGLSVFNRYIHN